MGEKWKQWQILFSWVPKSLQSGDSSHGIKRHWLLGRKATTHLDCILKSRDHFASKCPYSQSYCFTSSHVWMWKLDHKEGWAPKNWCFWTVVLGKILESHLDSKEIKWVHPKGNQPWIFIRRPDAETEAPILWLPLAKTLMLGRLRAGEGSDRGWDCWMALST